ncbi:hypothetical protein B566_EDAN002408 [Ephemera danica]|nr:hypothetical protein B566_EDAN002408 [Ephemera danica]
MKRQLFPDTFIAVCVKNSGVDEDNSPPSLERKTWYWLRSLHCRNLAIDCTCTVRSCQQVRVSTRSLTPTVHVTISEVKWTSVLRSNNDVFRPEVAEVVLEHSHPVLHTPPATNTRPCSVVVVVSGAKRGALWMSSQHRAQLCVHINPQPRNNVNNPKEIQFRPTLPSKIKPLDYVPHEEEAEYDDVSNFPVRPQSYNDAPALPARKATGNTLNNIKPTSRNFSEQGTTKVSVTSTLPTKIKKWMPSTEVTLQTEEAEYDDIGNLNLEPRPPSLPPRKSSKPRDDESDDDAMYMDIDETSVQNSVPRHETLESRVTCLRSCLFVIFVLSGFLPSKQQKTGTDYHEMRHAAYSRAQGKLAGVHSYSIIVSTVSGGAVVAVVALNYMGGDW